MRFFGAAALALIIGTPCQAQDRDHVPPRAFFPPVTTPAPTALPSSAPTAQDAETFIARVGGELARLSEHANRLGWVAATYINDDTNWLQEKLEAELSGLAVANAKAAARFDGIDVRADVRRKLEILKKGLVLPAP